MLGPQLRLGYQICDSQLQKKLRQRDAKFKVSLGYRVTQDLLEQGWRDGSVLKRTRIWFPAPTWQITSIRNSSSMESHIFF